MSIKLIVLFLMTLIFISSNSNQKHSVKDECAGAVIDETIKALSEYNKRFYDEGFTGVITKTFKESEILDWVLHYQDGEITKYERFYKNGAPKILSSVKCNSIHGNMIYYIDSGKKGYELEFYLGRKDGVGKSYFENGKIHKEVHYKNDLRDGIQYTFDENGDTILIENFKNGVQLK